MLSSSVTTFFRSFAFFCKQSQHCCGWNGYIYKLLDVCEAYYSIVCNLNRCHFTLRLQELCDQLLSRFEYWLHQTRTGREQDKYFILWLRISIFATESLLAWKVRTTKYKFDFLSIADDKFEAQTVATSLMCTASSVYIISSCRKANGYLTVPSLSLCAGTKSAYSSPRLF